MPHSRASLLFCLLLVSSCASGAGGSQPSPERVVVTDNGTQIRQIVNDDTRATFIATRANVWAALVASYADLGIAPSTSDQASGEYGNGGFVFPSHLRDRPIDDYFYCGSSLGNVGSSGRLVASVLSKVTSASDSETVVTTTTTGRFRSNAGTSSNAVDCSTRGALEQFIQVDIKRRLAMMH